MAIAEGYKHNFNELRRAVSNGDAALLETTEKATGKPAIVVVAVTFDGKEYQMVPMARMFDANPYDELDPPSGSSEQT
ncbi:MAG TPA: DUF6117 family protein [Edaphobacter sp.]|nr:DUF6117 family protein [Edaphobacter sp.]